MLFAPLPSSFLRRDGLNPFVWLGTFLVIVLRCERNQAISEVLKATASRYPRKDARLFDQSMHVFCVFVRLTLVVAYLTLRFKARGRDDTGVDETDYLRLQETDLRTITRECGGHPWQRGWQMNNLNQWVNGVAHRVCEFIKYHTTTKSIIVKDSTTVSSENRAHRPSSIHCIDARSVRFRKRLPILPIIVVMLEKETQWFW